MKIKTAEFIITVVAPEQLPPENYPEVAFTGKSNVGKSTLINSLLGRKGLVKTSATPGKTRAINFFLINQHFYLNDLPGYGFAKVSVEVKQTWSPLVEHYLEVRNSLRGVVFIVDSRHAPTQEDMIFKRWLEHYDVPFIVVANKIDKLKKNDVLKNLRQIQLSLQLPQLPIPHSSEESIGRSEIWKVIHSWIQ